VPEFKALEAVGPVEDQRILAALTAHEIQLIEWMRAETGSQLQAWVERRKEWKWLFKTLEPDPLVQAVPAQD
jgi:hypothetical protein